MHLIFSESGDDKALAIDNYSGDTEYLTVDEVRTYALITAGQAVDANNPHVQKLAAWGFVVFHPDRPGTPVALPPGEVTQRRMKEMLEEATARVASMRVLPAMTEQLSAVYDQAQWRASDGAEYIEDVAAVNARLDAVIGSAESQILLAQPFGPRTREHMAIAMNRDTAALARGVQTRTLYQARVRDSAVTAEYARMMYALGARYATLVGPFERAIIVDRRVAFISDHVVDGGPPHAAWQITNREFVAYIAEEFEGKWRRADQWQGELRSRRTDQSVDTVAGVEGLRTTRRQREIMRDAVLGKDQQATAKRLGISRRTLAEEIKALKDIAGVSTLTGLGFWWGRCADRLVDDSVPEAADEHTAHGSAA